MGKSKKDTIEVLNDQTELYKIMTRLKEHGRYSYSIPNKQKQANIAITIGMKGKPLVEKGLLTPPAVCRNHGINVYALPINVEIEEMKLRKKSIFKFKKKF